MADSAIKRCIGKFSYNFIYFISIIGKLNLLISLVSGEKRKVKMIKDTIRLNVYTNPNKIYILLFIFLFCYIFFSA